MDLFKLFMNDGMLGHKCTIAEKLHRVGDMVRFVPSIRIDHFTRAKTKRGHMRHVVYDVYEFTFRPIRKYRNNKQFHCYHYLIELGGDLRCFHYNWIKADHEYLLVGRYYEGYGRLDNCEDPSKYNPYVNPYDIEAITLQAQIEMITKNYILIDYIEKYRESKEGFDYKDALGELSYWDDFEAFKDNSRPHNIPSDTNPHTKWNPLFYDYIYCLSNLNMAT